MKGSWLVTKQADALKKDPLITHSIDVVEERRSITPGYFGFAGHVSQSQRGAAVQSLEAMSENVHRFIEQGRLNLKTKESSLLSRSIELEKKERK